MEQNTLNEDTKFSNIDLDISDEELANIRTAIILQLSNTLSPCSMSIINEGMETDPSKFNEYVGAAHFNEFIFKAVSKKLLENLENSGVKK
jgi:hypothetical protein